MWIGCLMLSFAICFAAMPAVIGLSWRLGAVDVPRDWRRMHRKSTPRAGGLAIFFAFALSCAATVIGTRQVYCAVGGGLLMLLLGVGDDVFSLDAWVKLFFQVAIAIATLLGYGFTRPITLLPAVFWVILLSNAHNLIDGLDGLFGGCATIEGGALAVSLLIGGAVAHAQATLCLVGGCMAFLFFNRHPARIFAGDCGSGTVGFLFGMLSLPLLLENGHVNTVLAVPLIFGYPLTDLIAAVLRRVLKGQSPFSADRAHLHHRVCAAGLPIKSCVLVFWTITLSLSTLGVLLLDTRLLPFSSLFCMGIALLLMRFRRFIAKIS